jgi:RNA polymerase primary sigma factor
MNYFGEINRFAKMNREDEIRFSKLMEFFSRRLAHHLEEKGVPKEFRDLIPALDGCKKSYEGDEIVPLCDKVGACPHGKKGVIRESCVSFSELRGEFVERNLHLVTSLSSQYRTYGIPLMDLIQEGNAALIRAVEKYDWRKGVRFQTYATFWIRQAVERCISANKYIVRVPNYLQQKMRRLKREGSIPADSSNLSIREVSDSFELSSEVAEHIIETGRGHVSIDSPSPTDNSRSLTDILYTEEKEVMPDDEVKTLKRRIKEALKVLNEQEQFIIHHRFGLEGKETKTLDEIGKLLRVSRERIRQIQIQALKKLKRPSLEEKLVPFIA